MATDFQRQLDELRDTVFGNGTEGLKTKMTKIEMVVTDLAESRKEMKNWLMGIASAVTIAAIIAAGTTLWQAAKIQATNELVVKAARQLNMVATEMVPAAAASSGE